MLKLPHLCLQLFQAEQRLQRSQQQLKDLQQAAADASPESKRPLSSSADLCTTAEVTGDVTGKELEC